MRIEKFNSVNNSHCKGGENFFMLKKLLSLTLLLSTMAIYFYSVPFIVEKSTVTCVGGKSSGRFIQEIVFYQNDGYMVTLSAKDATKFIKRLNCTQVYSQEINGITNYYFYTDKLPKKQVVKGEKINIHLAVKGGVVTLGYPFIYGSY